MLDKKYTGLFLTYARACVEKILCIAIVVYLGGCACHHEQDMSFSVIKPSDKYLNCEGIKFTIIETEYLFNDISTICAQPHIFANHFMCTAIVKRNAVRAQYILRDRISYLYALAITKKCPQMNIPANINSCDIVKRYNKANSSDNNVMGKKFDRLFNNVIVNRQVSNFNINDDKMSNAYDFIKVPLPVTRKKT